MSPSAALSFLAAAPLRLCPPPPPPSQPSSAAARPPLAMSLSPPRRPRSQQPVTPPDAAAAAAANANANANTNANLPNKWAVVTAASLVHALHAAAVYMVPATLLSPMRHALGLSVAQITQPLIVYRVVQAVLLLPAGLVLDVVGPQLFLRVAITAAAISAPLLPLASSLPHLILLQLFFAITKLLGGLSTMLVVVASAFPSANGMGTATSILLSGYSLAGFLAPAVIGTLSQRFGWRAASMLLSLLFSVCAVPLTFHFLREHPSSSSSSTRRPSIRTIFNNLTSRLTFSTLLQPQKQSSPARPPNPNPTATAPTNSSQSQSTVPTPSPNEPLFPPPYILVAVAVFAFSFSMHIVFDHLLVFLNEDFGMPFDRATLFMSALNLCSLCAKLAVGPLADRFNKSLLMAVFACVAAVASFLLLDLSVLPFRTTTSLPHVMAFVVLYSIGYAAVFSLTTAVLPQFGKNKLGFRSNFNLMLLFASGSLGSYMSAALRSATGTYKWPFVWNAFSWIFVVVAALAKFVLYDRNKPDAVARTAPPAAKARSQ